MWAKPCCNWVGKHSGVVKNHLGFILGNSNHVDDVELASLALHKQYSHGIDSFVSERATWAMSSTTCRSQADVSTTGWQGAQLTQQNFPSVK